MDSFLLRLVIPAKKKEKIVVLGTLTGTVAFKAVIRVGIDFKLIA